MWGQDFHDIKMRVKQNGKASRNEVGQMIYFVGIFIIFTSCDGQMTVSGSSSSS
ncbi:hypothetical protein V6Z11_A12G143500 [Gossypium hirsutum]